MKVFINLVNYKSINSVFILFPVSLLKMIQSNPNRIKIYRSASQRSNRSRLNATVFILTTVSFLLACYLTDKGFKNCLQAGKYSTIECEKLHYG